MSRLSTGIHGIEPEVVEDEQIDAQERAQLGLIAVVEPRMLEGLVQLVGAQRPHRVGAPAGDVAQGVRQKGLAHTDGPDDGHVLVRLQEA